MTRSPSDSNERSDGGRRPARAPGLTRCDDPLARLSRARCPILQGGSPLGRWRTGRQYPMALSRRSRQSLARLPQAHGPFVVGPDRAIRFSIGSFPREAHGPSVPRSDAVAGPASWAIFTASDPDTPGSHWPGSDRHPSHSGRLPLGLRVTPPLLAGWRPATDHPVHETLLFPMMTDTRLAR
jgi:hypothetical protein